MANIQEGYQVLDIAGGTGDLALAFSKKVGKKKRARSAHTDINEAMLRTGRDRLLDAGRGTADAGLRRREAAFPRNHFDLVRVAFGLRNMTHKDVALAEMNRVLKPGGKLLVLEFSKVAPAPGESLRLVFLQSSAQVG